MSRKKYVLTGTSLVFLVLVLLIMHRLLKKGSNAPLFLIPAPVLFTDPNVDPFDHIPPHIASTVVDVFYATNREGRGPVTDRRYTNVWNEKLHVGKAQVRFGDDKMSWNQLHAASISEDRSVPIPVRLYGSTELGVLGDTTFAQGINDVLATKRNKEIKIYIHGYKVDFAHGCQLGAQLHHFALREGVTIAFNWACRQRDITYFGDQKRAVQSIPDLVELVEYLAEHTDAERINLLAYSAGSPILSRALAELRQRHTELDVAQLFDKLKIDDVIFASSDLDIRQFVADLKVYYDLPQRILVTVCYDDAALSLSRKVHGRSRLGSADVNDLLANEIEALAERMDKIDVVDVTYSKEVLGTDIGWTGHGYWYRNPWISTDLLVMLYLNLLPEDRGLTLVPGREHAWYFTEDYPARVVEAVQNLERIRNMSD